VATRLESGLTAINRAKGLEQMAIPQWIDEQMIAQVGGVYFLARYAPLEKAEQWTLSETPTRTNMSLQVKLVGWCGNTNGVSVDAHGLARVEAILSNGRTRISPVDPESEEGQAALEALGFPDLA
jgi:hypothetical protein